MIKMMTSYLGSVYPWIPSILGNVHEPSTKYWAGAGSGRRRTLHGKCLKVMNIFLRMYLYISAVPAVETDGEKENNANGSEWEVEEVKLGTSVLLPAPGFTNWIHDAYHIISYFNGEGLGR